MSVRATCVRLPRRSAQEEEPVALGVRKQAQEVLFRDDQLALEHAILERRHNPVADPGQFELFAQFPVQGVGHRIGVGDGRNGAAGKRAIPAAARDSAHGPRRPERRSGRGAERPEEAPECAGSAVGRDSGNWHRPPDAGGRERTGRLRAAEYSGPPFPMRCSDRGSAAVRHSPAGGTRPCRRTNHRAERPPAKRSQRSPRRSGQCTGRCGPAGTERCAGPGRPVRRWFETRARGARPTGTGERR